MKKIIVKIIIPILIIASGFYGMKLLTLMKKPPLKESKEDLGVLVESIVVSESAHEVILSVTGSVQAKRQVDIIPQVRGKVNHVSLKFERGGFFKKGQAMFSIEKIDYQLAVRRAKATVAQAELALATERSKAAIAKKEWKSLSKNEKTAPNPLVLYKPQLKSAKANLDSALASLKQAKLDLRRTTIYAPFNCRVSSKNVEVGQYVQSGVSVARVAGTDKAEIIVPVSVDDLRLIALPGNKKKDVKKATLRFKGTTWQAALKRTLGEVDIKTRMASLVLEVSDPYKLKNSDSNGLNLEVGMFVEATIYGREIGPVVEIPNKALRTNSTVWTIGNDNKLEIKKVTVVRHQHDSVLVSKGLKNEDKVVVTALNGAANGMKLRLFKKAASERENK